MEVEDSINAAASYSSPTTTSESETLVSQPDHSSPPAAQDGSENPVDGESKPTSVDHKDIFRAVEVVERDSVAIAESFTSLFDSLRLALSEMSIANVFLDLLHLGLLSPRLLEGIVAKACYAALYDFVDRGTSESAVSFDTFSFELQILICSYLDIQRHLLVIQRSKMIVATLHLMQHQKGTGS